MVSAEAGRDVMLQDMADAASRAAAVDTLERLLAQPDLWAQQQTVPSPWQDGDGTASFGGGGWADAVAELAAKARQCYDASVVAHTHTHTCTHLVQSASGEAHNIWCLGTPCRLLCSLARLCSKAPAAHTGVAAVKTTENNVVRESQVYASPSEMAAAMLGAIAGVLRGGSGAGAGERAGVDGAADEAAAGAGLPATPAAVSAGGQLQQDSHMQTAPSLAPAPP